MGNDREDLMPDWTTPEYMANIAAEELRHALTGARVGFTECFGLDDGDVSIQFKSIFHAEVMMVSAFRGPDGPGSLYDRATGSCVTLSALQVDEDAEVPEADIGAAFEAGWTWMIHPDMKPGHVGWHVGLTIPAADAMQVAALVNAMLNEGRS